MKDDIMVSVDKVSMRFNLGQEKIDSLKAVASGHCL